MMRVISMTVALAIISSGGAFADVREEITQRERAFYEAFVEVDTEIMEDIFADSFLYQHGSGQDFNEAQFLEMIGSKAAVVVRADPPQLRILDFGDTITTSGASYVEGRIGEEKFGGTLRFVNVWHNEAGVWRLYHRNSQFVE